MGRHPSRSITQVAGYARAGLEHARLRKSLAVKNSAADATSCIFSFGSLRPLCPGVGVLLKAVAWPWRLVSTPLPATAVAVDTATAVPTLAPTHTCTATPPGAWGIHRRERQTSHRRASRKWEGGSAAGNPSADARLSSSCVCASASPAPGP